MNRDITPIPNISEPILLYFNLSPYPMLQKLESANLAAPHDRPPDHLWRAEKKTARKKKNTRPQGTQDHHTNPKPRGRRGRARGRASNSAGVKEALLAYTDLHLELKEEPKGSRRRREVGVHSPQRRSIHNCQRRGFSNFLLHRPIDFFRSPSRPFVHRRCLFPILLPEHGSTHRNEERRSLAQKESDSSYRIALKGVFSIWESTDPPTLFVRFDCLAALECILNVIRTLPMGSCLSSDGRSGGPSPSSPDEEELCGIPGRMCLNGATSTASLFTQQGKKGTNQDAMIVWENFGGRSDTVFCGVFDGHGPNGHMVARKVRDIIPLNLRANWQLHTGNHYPKENCIDAMTRETIPSASFLEEPRDSDGYEGKDGHLKFFKAWKDSFLEAFRVVDKELSLHPEIDCFFSGTTAVALLKQGQDLVIGNVGDSRAVLGTRDENNSLIAVQLTTDLKPSLPREAERIRRHRGRVFAMKNEPEVARVWLPNRDWPGLAMARAFGDFCLKDFGLISVPEVSYRRVTAKDEFVVLATDGVWDVLSNKDAVSIVASAPTRSSSARSLVESAALAWEFKYPTSKIDDCAVVCLFLNSDGWSTQ